jgi:hypothetical protein
VTPEELERIEKGDPSSEWGVALALLVILASFVAWVIWVVTGVDG